MNDILIKIIFMLIGGTFGFIITWSFVGHTFWQWKEYKKRWEDCYENYFWLHKYACEAWWILKHNYYKDKKYRSVDEAFFELNHYFEDYKEK